MLLGGLGNGDENKGGGDFIGNVGKREGEFYSMGRPVEPG